MTDALTIAVLIACALSCSAFVLFCNYIIRPALKALWARHKASDDPFGNAAYGDIGFINSDDLELLQGDD